MRKTKLITLSALAAALGVIAIALGSLLDVMDLSAAVLAALVVLFCVLEMGYGYAAMVYLTVSVLSVILLPNKSAALLFALLFGYMPIVKFWFERKLGRLSVIPKLIIYNLLFGAVVTFGAELTGFTVENAWSVPPAAIYALYFVLANILFAVCDLLFARMARFYFFRIRERIRKYLK